MRRISAKRSATRRATAAHHKHAVLTLVERGGKARSFHINNATAKDIVPIVHENIAKESRFMTDEARHYWTVGNSFLVHGAVSHKKGEYDRGTIHTNMVEGFYSIFKRGMKGVYQHCGEQHLHRYLTEFDFRYSNRIKLGIDDKARALKAIKGIVGKRLTYRRTDERPKPLRWGNRKLRALLRSILDE